MSVPLGRVGLHPSLVLRWIYNSNPPEGDVFMIPVHVFHRFVIRQMHFKGHFQDKLLFAKEVTSAPKYVDIGGGVLVKLKNNTTD